MTTKNILIGFFGLSFFYLTSCNHRLRILSDGWTRITTDDKNYNNRNLFNSELLKILDTNSIYKECCYLQNLDSSFFGFDKSKKYRSISYPNQKSREYFRFYNDGYCNCFINDEVGNFYNFNNFNPEITGFRGVYFRDKKNRIRVDLFTQTSGAGSYSNLNLYLTVSGDTLFMRMRNVTNSYRVFIKSELPNEIQNVKGWGK